MLKIIEQRYNLIDKSKLPAGEWMSEPDMVRLIDEDTRTPCVIMRQGSELGHLCGYIGVWEGSSLWCKHYDDVRIDIELTFAGFIEYSPELKDIYWYGWDHAHAGDIVPGMLKLFSRRKGLFGGNETYKNIAYVIEEMEPLVRQLKLIEQYVSRNRYRSKDHQGQKHGQLKGAL